MSNFSPSMTLGGMDYIAPSAECILPTKAVALAAKAAAAAQGDATVTRHDPGQPLPLAVHPPATRQEVMKITLQDCLACSGCVTTAETILVEAQSRRELCSCLGLRYTEPEAATEEEERLRAARAAADPPPVELTEEERAARRQRPVLVTVSEQSAASLAAHCGLSAAEAFATVVGFFRQVMLATAEDDNHSDSNCEVSKVCSERAVYVSDLRWALDISARLTAEEYERRVAAATANEGDDPPTTKLLPMLVSACPGWVCYCEKQGGALLPLLCPVLSPQGVAGSLVKRTAVGGPAAALYHVSIQPCFDRKLEAARDGYFPPGEAPVRTTEAGEPIPTPYTDCVLSTAELLEWMEEVDPALPWRGRLDSCLDCSASNAAAGSLAVDGAAVLARMEGSGGYHRRAMELVSASRVAAGGEEEVAPATAAGVIGFAYEVKRNRNHQIATSPSLPTSTTAFKHCFCIAYGFQQIQNIVRGLKKNLPAARQYTYVELMACPDGCLNGGGQLRVSADPLGHAQQLEKASAAFAGLLTSGCSHSKDEEEEQGDLVFSPAAVRRMAGLVGPDAFRCVFRDRQKEFEEMLDQGNIHSLKW